MSIQLHPSTTKLWCRKCLVETGIADFTGPEDKKVQKIDPPLTLEDLIREIVREELEYKEA